MIPLEFGTPAQFAAVRTLLEEANYTEKAVCERLGFSAMSECLKTLQPWEPPARDALDVLIRIFLRGESVNDGEIHPVLPSPGLPAMFALGLLAPDPAKPDCSYAPVALYPAQALIVASDRWVPFGERLDSISEDIVYPAITPETLDFLRSLPRDPCDDFLDLCAGTGIAAFMAATTYAKRAWAFDITERATQFAEFNRLLNGIPNATMARGDLYEPAGAQVFDRIVAHPPYMPVLESKWLYHDGGEDGEQITRRIVEGLPRHLRPGGRLYLVALGTDREGEPLERRVRGWLGRDESEFDLLLIAWTNIETESFAVKATLRAKSRIEDIETWRTRFEKLKVTNLVHGSLVIRRKNTPGAPFTMRCEKSAQGGSVETEWLLQWVAATSGPGIIPFLLDSRPTASPRLEMTVLHRMTDGELNPSVYTIEVAHPFHSRNEVQPWVAYLLTRCDGKVTAREHLAYFKERGCFHTANPEAEFAGVLHSLIAAGFIVVGEFRVKPPEEATDP